MNDLSSKIIGVLLTIVVSLFAFEMHRLLGALRNVVRRQKEQRLEMKAFIRTMFTLMARLYPEKAELITKEMQKFFLDDMGEEDSPRVSRWRQPDLV